MPVNQEMAMFLCVELYMPVGTSVQSNRHVTTRGAQVLVAIC